MKLFRHHSQEFQKEIENNNSFVLDNSRHFNHTGENKNEAEIYFYATTKEGAEAYANDDTQLFTYEASDVNLLDLRKEEDRTLLQNVIADILKEQEEARKGIISDMKKSVAKEKKKRIIASMEKSIKYYEGAVLNVENIIKDTNHIAGRTYWGQGATDFKRGLILKEEAIALGYDGIIFQESIRVVEVGLFNPAKLIK